MKVDAVVYTSKNGSTKKYARMLSRALNIPDYSLEDSYARLAPSDRVIYLGWIKGNRIQGYEKANERYIIRLLCGVGIFPGGKDLETVKKRNNVPVNLPVYTIQGAFDIHNFHPITQFLVKNLLPGIKKRFNDKEKKDERTQFLLEMVEKGGDFVGLDKIQDILIIIENTN